MADANSLSIVDAQRAIRAGTLSSTEVVKACLARIDARESVVKAWVHLDREAALAEAARLDELGASGDFQGPLHGIPVGIKDIFDVAGMPTAAGTDAHQTYVAETDAASVARLRHAGAIVLGKTVTTAYATGDPGPTTNPWNAARTPGGSSSGSGAAVGDRMCLAALGTQTAGSVIRPCAYNGIAGIKPGHGRIDVRGVIALSWRLDHVGAMTRDVNDANLLWQVLRDDHDWREIADASMDLDTLEPERPLRLWRPGGVFKERADDNMNALMDAHCEALASRRVNIIERDLPAEFDAMFDHHMVIMDAEAATTHAENFSANAQAYPPSIRGHIENGQRISATRYLDARQHRRVLIDRMARAMMDVDGVITPAAAGAAPEGLAHTGDRSFNAPSSYLGMPVVTYPGALDTGGMPLGIQIMGRPEREDELLKVTTWCADLAGFKDRPQP